MLTKHEQAYLEAAFIRAGNIDESLQLHLDRLREAKTEQELNRILFSEAEAVRTKSETELLCAVAETKIAEFKPSINAKQLRQERLEKQNSEKIISREKFLNLFRSVPELKPEMLKKASDGFQRASLMAVHVFPLIRKLGFFSSRAERINAFQLVCMRLDECVEERLITQAETMFTLIILQYSSEDFLTATKAFIGFARGNILDGRHLCSYTAGVYAEYVR